MLQSGASINDPLESDHLSNGDFTSVKEQCESALRCKLSPLMNTFSHLAAEHWVLGGIVVSLLWFAAGRQSLSNRRPDAALFWQVIAVIIAVILCGWTIVERYWLGLIAGACLLSFEVLSIMRHTLGQHRQ